MQSAKRNGSNLRGGNHQFSFILVLDMIYWLNLITLKFNWCRWLLGLPITTKEGKKLKDICKTGW